MSATNDGGPAYPMGYHRDGNSADHQGMSLRDWFAGQALACLKHEGRLKKQLRTDGGGGGFSVATIDHFGAYPNTEFAQAHQWRVKSTDAHDIAADAYAIADAMLAARGAK